MDDDNDDAEPPYKTGKGKPPLGSRYKPGQSGNKNGRPRGAKNKKVWPTELSLAQIVLEEGQRQVKVPSGTKQTTMPIMQTIIRALNISAARGSARAQVAATKFYFESEKVFEKRHDAMVDEILGHKQKAEHDIELAKLTGQPLPTPLPHPKYIKYEPETGEVIIDGPISKAQEKIWRKINAQIRSKLEEIGYCLAVIRDDKEFETELRSKIVQLHVDIANLRRELREKVPVWRSRAQME